MDDDAIRRDLLRRASDLVPVLKERAARTEQLRQIPPESVQDLISSGLIWNPLYAGSSLYETAPRCRGERSCLR